MIKYIKAYWKLFLHFFVKRRAKKRVAKAVNNRKDTLKNEGYKFLSSRIAPGKNLKLFAYDKEIGVVYEVLIEKKRGFLNPDHPTKWALDLKRAKKKFKATIN